MAYAVEAIGTLVLNVMLFTGGMAFALAGIILGIARSTTKNNDHWAIIFSAFAWLISIIISNVWYSSILFGLGAFALSLSFMPIIEKAKDANIFVLATIAGIMSMMILIGSGAYNVSLAWQSNMDQSINDINSLLGTSSTNLDGGVPEYQLCEPNQINEDGTPCTSDTISGSFDANLFVPFASVLTIGTYIGKAIAFIGMVTLAPTILGNTLASTGYFANSVVILLMGLLVNIWNIAIFYKLMAFILNKRGMK